MRTQELIDRLEGAVPAPDAQSVAATVAH
jgi:hypothetical protein